jgi:hypothetical protein
MSGDMQPDAADCGHPACKSDDIERKARDAAAAVLGDEDLIRVCEQETPEAKPDFRSCRHALEIKELTSQSLLKFFDARAKHLGEDDPRLPIEELTQVWMVWADVSDAIESFDGNTKTPRADSLIKSLTPLLKDLEARGVNDAFGDDRSWFHITRLLGSGAHCSVVPDAVAAGMKPGIFLSVAHGHSRTMYLEDDVVTFLQGWLDSEYSTNARESLAREKRSRVVALVASIDGPAAAMLRTLSETAGVAIPTPLRLPSEIDALIVTTGQEVLHFDRGAGWSRHTSESLGL